MFFKRYISEDTTAEAITSGFRYVPADSRERDFKGEIAALVTVSGDGSFQADRAVKFVWDGILDGYLYSEGGSTIDHVKKAIASGSRKIVELMKHDKELEQKGINLSFAVAVIKEKTGYLGVFGEEEVYIYKSSGFVNISSVLAQNSVTVASVALEDEDLILLASPVLLSAFTDVVEAGVDSKELISRLDTFSGNLMGNQGILVLSRGDFVQELEGEREEVSSVVTESEESTEVLGEEELEASSSEVSNRMAEPNEKLSGVIDDVKGRLSGLAEKFAPVKDRLGAMFSGVSLRLRGVLEDRYGRKMWYKRILARVSSFKLRGGPSAYGMKIDGYKIAGLRNQRFGLVGMVLIAILVVWGGVTLVNNAKRSRELHREVEAVSQVVEAQINIASRDITADRGSAESAIFVASEELKKIDGKDLSTPDLAKVKELKGKVQDLDDRLNKVKVIKDGENLERFLNTRIELDDRSNPTDMTIYRDDRMNEFLIITDSGSRSVYKVGLFNKSSKSTFTDSDGVITDPRHVNIGEEGIYVYDIRNGIVRSAFDGEGHGSFASLVGLSIDDIGTGDVGNLAIFSSSDEVYMLSKSQSALVKSARTGSGGYGLPFAFLSGETLSSASDIFGDYSVYILTNRAEGLERYSFRSGELVLNPVSIVGLTGGLEGPKYGYTGSSLDNLLYIFDESKRRILVFEKPNEAIGATRHPNEMWLVGQYVYRGDDEKFLKNVKSIVVDYSESNMYILDDRTVWKISLK